MRHQNAPLELVILIGLQAAGKSSFYRDRFSRTHQLISKDLMRNPRHKERRQAGQVESALRAGHSVVVDNTNPSMSSRAALIALGRAHGAQVVGYYFEPDLKGSLERNRRRQGKARVPDVGIFATARHFEVPSLAEDFDRIYQVRMAAGSAFEVTGFEGTRN